MTNEALYDRAMAAINRLFADMSVSKKMTVARLRDLIEEIESLIDTIDAAKEAP
jgi:hypothetical protein